MNKHINDRKEQWREIEACLGGRHNDGKECPRYVLDIYKLAECDAEGESDFPEVDRLRQHFDQCPFCRHTYESALDAAERDLETLPAVTPAEEITEALPASVPQNQSIMAEFDNKTDLPWAERLLAVLRSSVLRSPVRFYVLAAVVVLVVGLLFSSMRPFDTEAAARTAAMNRLFPPKRFFSTDSAGRADTPFHRGIQVRNLIEMNAIRQIRTLERAWSIASGQEAMTGQNKNRIILAAYRSEDYEFGVAAAAAAALEHPDEHAPLDVAVAVFGAKYLLNRSDLAGMRILPVNGEKMPSRGAWNDSQAAAYYFAEIAVHRLRAFFRVVDIGEAAFTHHLKIEVDAVPPDMRNGTITFSVLETTSGKMEMVEEAQFAHSRPPIPFLRTFGEVLDRRDATPSNPGRRSDEFSVTFKGTESPDSMITFGSADGIPVTSEKFGTSGVAELCFEAKALSPFPRDATVEFAVGGSGLSRSWLPPRQLSDEWTRIIIPVDLSSDPTTPTTWRTGLTITVRGLSTEGDKVTIRIRNAFIRPLGAASEKVDSLDQVSVFLKGTQT